MTVETAPVDPGLQSLEALESGYQGLPPWYDSPRIRPLITLAGQAVFSGTTFVSGAIVARTTSPEQFGIYSLVFIALAWALSMQGALVTTPYTFARRALDHSGQREYAGTVIWSQLAFASVATALLAGAAGIAHLSRDPATSAFVPVLLVVGVVSGVCLLRECCRQIAFGHEAYASVVALDTSVAVVQLGGLAIIGYLHVMSAVSAFIVIGAATVLPTCVWLWIHRELFDLRHPTLRGHAAQSWQFGKWIVAGVLLHALAKDTFPWILSILHGTRAAGTLAAAFGVAFLVNPILTATTNMLGPLFARRLADDGPAALHALVMRYTRLAILLAALYGGVLMIAGTWLTTLIYGPQYAESGRVAGWLALGIAASVVTLPIGVGLYAMRRTSVTFRAVCVAVVIAVVISGPLVYRYAAWGVAFALLLENIGESLAKAWWYRGIVRAEQSAAVPVVPGQGIEGTLESIAG